MHSHVFELDCLANKLSLIEIVVIGWLVLIINRRYYVQNAMHKTDYKEHLRNLFFRFQYIKRISVLVLLLLLLQTQ